MSPIAAVVMLGVKESPPCPARMSWLDARTVVSSVRERRIGEYMVNGRSERTVG